MWYITLTLCLCIQRVCANGETCTTNDANLCHLNSEQTAKYVRKDLTDEEMFKNGHLKPFGSHQPPESNVEELPFMISPKDFYMKYVIKHRPVVIKGAVKDWPAYKLWSDDYLNSTYGDVLFNMETKDDDKFNLPKAMKLKDFLKVYQKADRYLVDEVTPDMRKEIVLPLCLRCEEMDRYFFVSYFWFSQGNTKSTMHLDTDENLLCVIKGHKEVLMVSPEYSADLYADNSRVLGVLDLNVSAVDLEKYPRVKNIHYVKANVNEGDMVYIPQMWWHHVYSRPGRQQAVALWWKSKPWPKNGNRTAMPLQDKGKTGHVKDSFAGILADYERWVQNVSDDQPMITCKEQQVLMSNYDFETDKDPNAKKTMGDDGDLKEENLKLFEEVIKKARLKGKNPFEVLPITQLPCDFDRANVLSPCHYKQCHVTDNDISLNCIRYMLDYCSDYDDRGCVIHLPNFLNKLDHTQYKNLQTLQTEYGKDQGLQNTKH